MENIIHKLRERGFINETTPDLEEAVKNPLKLYCGFDPTADSLHVGNMVGIMALGWFQRYGHTPVVISGGATGMIGDPSGKSIERNLLDEATLQRNVAAIARDLKPILNRDAALPAPIYLNNYDWFKEFSMIQFLRDIGKHFRVGTMLSKDSVKSRMQSEEGISYTEFSYQILQAYDFYHLFQHHGVSLEIGGADQWGNIVAGIEVVRKLTSKHVHGLTWPLLTKADGQKFGKSEKGAIWLNPDKLSAYEFYQYMVRTDDRDVIKLLRMLTFLEMSEIHEIEKQTTPNYAQKVLAKCVTELVHGPEGVQKALVATEQAAPGKDAYLTGEELRKLMTEIPSATLPKSECEGRKIIDVITAAGFVPSKGEARRLIRNGGLSLNNKKVLDEEAVISLQECVEGEFLLFSLGKKNKSIVRIETS